MAIYRFRVSFEDYEDVYRDIDMPSKSTFMDLHNELHKTTGYATDISSSFYVSNDQWKKGTEIAHLPTARKQEAAVLLMEDVRLSKFIDDPHQKFYYIYNFDRPYDFHVELIKILKEEDGVNYPSIFKSVGLAPKTAAFAHLAEADLATKEEEEFVDETEYGVDDEEDFDLFDDEESSSEEEGQQSSGFEDEY